MCCTSVFTCIMGTVSIFSIIAIILCHFTQTFLWIFFHKCNILLHLDMILVLLLLKITFFLFKINYIFACSLKAVQNFFIQSFPRYKVCLFSMWSNSKIVGIEYSQGKCSPIFVEEVFTGLFAHPSVFPIEDSYITWFHILIKF